MLKKRAESKKKKSTTNTNKNQKPILASHTDKILLKLTGGYNVKPNIYGITQVNKTPKSATATPSSKIRKPNKENFYNSVFHSKKTSETTTPFDYEQDIVVSKSRNDFWFLFQIGSGGFGRVWKVEEKKTKTIYAMK